MASYVGYKNLKFLLLLAALCVLGGATYTFYLNEEDEQHQDKLNEGHQNDIAGDSLQALNSMSLTGNNAINPHFQAVDEKGQSYTIKAKSAVARDTDDIIVLSSPSYTIQLTTKTQIAVTAQQGFLDQDKKKLTLEGDVVVHYGDETTFTMPKVRINLKDSDAFGDQSIQVVNKTMHIRAGAFDIQHRGDRVILTDKPVLTFMIKSPSKEKHPS
ncbi:MAG: LPS export ABC transporter periplasmic protein LptC [Alphaproteobacteria bacterium]|nr:LPS export ABC transporter periplasmic protein LptC [Alphaproteobacteria bacterium]